MSAGEFAAVLEGWATFVGLFVVVAGALFAGVQLRWDRQSRHLQAMVAVFENVRSQEVIDAWRRVVGLPEGFIVWDLEPADRDAGIKVMNAYARLGMLYGLGLVKAKDIFGDPALSRQAVEVWERLKYSVRAPRPDRGPLQEAVPNAVYFERLARDAQAYLLREGLQRFGNEPVFDADWPALRALAADIDAARGIVRSAT